MPMKRKGIKFNISDLEIICVSLGHKVCILFDQLGIQQKCIVWHKDQIYKWMNDNDRTRITENSQLSKGWRSMMK